MLTRSSYWTAAVGLGASSCRTWTVLHMLPHGRVDGLPALACRATQPIETRAWQRAAATVEAAGDRDGQARPPTRLFPVDDQRRARPVNRRQGPAGGEAHRRPRHRQAGSQLGLAIYNPRLEARGWDLFQGISRPGVEDPELCRWAARLGDAGEGQVSGGACEGGFREERGEWKKESEFGLFRSCPVWVDWVEMNRRVLLGGESTRLTTS
jgi:hypothetical protein